MFRSRRMGTLSLRSSLVENMGRFRKKQVTGDNKVIGAGKKGEDEKTKTEKAYADSLLKSYKYVKPK